MYFDCCGELHVCFNPPTLGKHKAFSKFFFFFFLAFANWKLLLWNLPKGGSTVAMQVWMGGRWHALKCMPNYFAVEGLLLFKCADCNEMLRYWPPTSHFCTKCAAPYTCKCDLSGNGTRIQSHSLYFGTSLVLFVYAQLVFCLMIWCCCLTKLMPHFLLNLALLYKTLHYCTTKLKGRQRETPYISLNWQSILSELLLW